MSQFTATGHGAVAVLTTILAIAIHVPNALAEVVPRPRTEIPDGTGERFRAMWREGQKLLTQAQGLEGAIEMQQADCSNIDLIDDAKIAECDQWAAELRNEWDRYTQALSGYEQALDALWTECQKAWQVDQILPSTGPREVNAEGCSLRPGVYSPTAKTMDMPDQKGLVTHEPPSPVPLKVDPKIFPEKEVLKIGRPVANLVLDALQVSLGDLRNSERELEYRAFGSPSPDYDLEQAASYVTGMRYGAELVGASPRATTQEDIRRYMLPTEYLDHFPLFSLPPPEVIKRKDEASSIVIFQQRDTIAQDTLKETGGDVTKAIQILEKQAIEQPISPTHLALRAVQGIHVYLTTLQSR